MIQTSEYVKRNDNGVVILLIWIDDVLSGASLNAAGATILKELVVVLKEQFKIRELGLVTKFIGLHVTQDLSSGTITIDQKLYAEELVKEHLGANAKTKDLPLPVNFSVTENDCPKTASDRASMERFPFRQLLGALMWLMVGPSGVKMAVGQFKWKAEKGNQFMVTNW